MMRWIVFFWLLTLSLPTLAQSPSPSPPTPHLIRGADVPKVIEEVHPFLLDVREPSEIQDEGALAGAVNIPVDELEKRMGEVPHERTILVY
jgi:hypothetical protein